MNHSERTRGRILVLAACMTATAATPAARHEGKEAPHASAPQSSPAPSAKTSEPANAHAAADHAAAHWGYEGVDGPVHWGHLSPDYQLCSAGRMQSPVDLSFSNVTANVTVAADYKYGPLTILNNGHTIQVNFKEGSSLLSSGRRFNLVQVHFHTPSENMLNGKSYPMEAHFVHRDAAGQLAVLGVFFDEGPTNVELAKLVVAAPNIPGGPNTIEGFNFDPRALLPADLRVYRLMGSLTTPPCSEGVNWHVAKATVTASASQIAALAKLMGNNARPIQPLNGRLMIAPE